MADKKSVLVTGGTGFIGSHVVVGLLQEGYRVRVGLREGADPDLQKQLRGVVPPTTGDALTFVTADVTKQDGWDSACADCWALVHLVGKMPQLGNDFEEDFLRTLYLEGTKTVMKAAVRQKVKKFIFVSACLALNGCPAPIYDGQVFTEKDWCDPDRPGMKPRDKTITLTEKYVWDAYSKLPANTMDVTVLVSTMSAGPPLLRRSECRGTLSIVEVLLNRTLPGIINVVTVFSDVRDLSTAIRKTLVTPAAVGERIIVNTGSVMLPDLAGELSKEFNPQGFSVLTRTIPYFLVAVTAKLFSKQLGMSPDFDKKFYVDNKKMKTLLDIQPRPWQETAMDMTYGMIDLGFFPKTANYRKVGSRVIKADKKK